MQLDNQTRSTPESPSLISCFGVVLSIFFGLLGLLIGLGVLWFAYVFIVSKMLNPASILCIAITALISIIFIFLAFRVNKQKWYLSLGLVVLAWGVLGLFLGGLINYSTVRMTLSGISMQPALAAGDYVIVDKLAYSSKLPQRGDIILYSDPFMGETWIKRVIGLPGENVAINSGHVYIDGVLLQEPDTISLADHSGKWQVGDAEYFVLGDNRNNSADSRAMGNVPLENILGKVTYICLPFSRAGKISNAYHSP